MKEIIYGLFIAAVIGAAFAAIYYADKDLDERSHQCKVHGGAMIRTGGGYECLKVERVMP